MGGNFMRCLEPGPPPRDFPLSKVVIALSGFKEDRAFAGCGLLGPLPLGPRC
jgi:hypothetical protein